MHVERRCPFAHFIKIFLVSFSAGKGIEEIDVLNDMTASIMISIFCLYSVG